MPSKKKYRVAMFPIINGERTKVVQLHTAVGRRAARKAAKENVNEEYGSDIWGFR